MPASGHTTTATAKGPPVNTYLVRYLLDLTPDETIRAAYYSVEDGFLTFKNGQHQHLRSIAAGTVWSVEKVGR